MLIRGQRSLAHIERIEWVRPIEGADNIELVGVLGWSCIAKKGEFQAGDKAVYIEIDSRVSAEEPFLFLASKDFKVKTMKLGKFKVISQGLALPLSYFHPSLGNYEVGEDVTEVLKIVKIEDEVDAPVIRYTKKEIEFLKHPIVVVLMKFKWFRKMVEGILLKRSIKRAWPVEVSKTEEERIENMPYLLGDPNCWVITEKLDGTSTTYLARRKRKKIEFIVCSRNHRLTEKDNIYWRNAVKYDIEGVLTSYLKHHPEAKWVAIQGESIGPSVQGNPYKLTEEQFYAFNFIDSNRGRYDSLSAYEQLTSYNVPFVPIVGMAPLRKTMEETKKDADGNSEINKEVKREGLVYRRVDGGASFKNISREYLLKNKK